MRGIHDRAEKTDLQVQLANTRYQPLEEERLIRLFLSQSPAALILVGIDQTEGAAELLSAAEQPVAQIMELGPQPFDMMVGFSQFDAGRAMTEHLLSAGYRRIAFLAARLDPRSNRRMAGYSAVMAERSEEHTSELQSPPRRLSEPAGLARPRRHRPDRGSGRAAERRRAAGRADHGAGPTALRHDGRILPVRRRPRNDRASAERRLSPHRFPCGAARPAQQPSHGWLQRGHGRGRAGRREPDGADQGTVLGPGRL